MKITPLFSAMDISASGLAAQRQRMNTVAENLANAETTRTAQGGPYRRQKVAFEHSPQFAKELEIRNEEHNLLARTHPDHLVGRERETEGFRLGGVKAQVIADSSPFREIYDPSHPDADAQGIVRMPNVDIVREMTELISASRAFEANATAFNASKNMMKKALEL